MLVPAAEQRARNNLIMRCRAGGAGAVLLLPTLHRQLAEPETCQAVSCLSPCFSLAPRRAAVRADGAEPHRRAAQIPSTSPPSPRREGMLTPGLAAGTPRVRWVAVLTSCPAEAIPGYPKSLPGGRAARRAALLALCNTSVVLA